jgi:lactate 2-monooxygenase
MNPDASAGPGPERQRATYLAGVAGRRPRIPPDAGLLEEQARGVMSRTGFAYVAGAAGSERSLGANLAAFDRWRIVPRMLRDVARRETGIRLFGRDIPAPVLFAPVGVLEMAHRDADLAVARAAAGLGLPYIFSSQASVPMETCAAAMGGAPRWFQLYWSRADEVMRSFVRRAEAAGCEAVVVTLDTPMLGWRPRDLALGCLPFLYGRGIAQYTSDPVFRASLEGPPPEPAPEIAVTPSSVMAAWEQARRYPGPTVGNLVSGVGGRAVRQFLAIFSRPTLVWDDLGRLRDATRLPILLKGILHPDDATRAVAAGVDGLVVSNHGGRQLDGAVAALDALPPVVQAVAGRIPILFDSGIRTGADIFKALALGATAVCIGRPYVYGLALAGEAGVREVMENLLAEFDVTLALAGCGSVAEVGRGMLVDSGSAEFRDSGIG